MNRSYLKKGIGVIVIFLFISVTVTPSINFNVVKASSDNEIIEVTSEACGIKGFGNTTVKLTRQQYQNLEKYLVEFSARLNTTTTKEEAVPIFKEAVVELSKYGLLPKGMSVERAQRLVVGPNQENFKTLQEKVIHNHFLALDNNSNYFCLIAGKATTCYVASPLIRILNFFDLLGFGFLFDMLNGGLMWMLTWDWVLCPIYPLGVLCFGYYVHTFGGVQHWEPSIGSIFSVGALGIKIVNGEFYGGIIDITLHNIPAGISQYFIGVTGFIGVHISTENGNTQFLGGCIRFNVNSK